MSCLGRAEEGFDDLMQVSLSNFCLSEQSRTRAHLKSKFISELRLPSLSIIMLNTEYIVLINFTRGESYFKMCFWSY